MPRQSIISRQSVGLFFEQLPHNETDFANKDIFSAFHEIMNDDLGLSKEMSIKEKMRIIIRSHKFDLFCISLVVIDCICVIFQMVLDVLGRKLRHHTHTTDNSGTVFYTIELGVECFSLFILSIFLVLIVFRFILLSKEYYRSRLEMFDAIIVVSSFILEIISIVKGETVREFEVTVITFRFGYLIMYLK